MMHYWHFAKDTSLEQRPIILSIIGTDELLRASSNEVLMRGLLKVSLCLQLSL